MQEAVSEILNERAQMTDGMSRMVVLSLVGHGILIASLLIAPDFWGHKTAERVQPMMITLGGAEGPDAGGMTTIANRAVQRVAEPDAKPDRPTPPADKPPEMTAPEPTAKPAPKTPAKPIEKPKESATSRKPTSGAEIKSGAARVETGGAQIPFGGLATGGGGTGGARVDVANFCCPSYLAGVVSVIKRNWQQNQGLSGKNTIKFVIQRDGRLDGIAVDESGGQLLDMASQRALVVTRQVAPLPREFTGNTLTVYLIFEYSR